MPRLSLPKILPSVMSKTQTQFTKTLQEYNQFTTHVHLDVTDGKFAKSKVLQFPLKFPRKATNKTNSNNKELTYSAHLMINNPMPWIKKYQENIQLFIPHIETFKDPTVYLDYCKEHNLKTAFACLPTTTYRSIKAYLKTNKLHYLLILTVNPGFYGSPFLPKQLQKIKKIKQFIEQNNLKTKLIADGGMNQDRIPKTKKAGADYFVVGSKIKNQPTTKDKQAAYKKLTKSTKTTGK